jgi:hypothetical protein
LAENGRTSNQGLWVFYDGERAFQSKTYRAVAFNKRTPHRVKIGRSAMAMHFTRDRRTITAYESRSGWRSAAFEFARTFIVLMGIAVGVLTLSLALSIVSVPH